MHVREELGVGMKDMGDVIFLLLRRACCCAQVHCESDGRGDVLLPVRICDPVCQSRSTPFSGLTDQHRRQNNTQPELPYQVRLSFSCFPSLSSISLLVPLHVCTSALSFVSNFSPIPGKLFSWFVVCILCMK